MVRRCLFPCTGYGSSRPAHPQTTPAIISSGSPTAAHPPSAAACSSPMVSTSGSWAGPCDPIKPCRSSLGLPGLRSHPSPGPAQFADDVKDSPSGSRSWCYQELRRSCQLECAVGFLVTRSLLIAPGGGEEGLIFSGLCKSLSAPQSFCFGARGSGCDLCTLAQHDRAPIWTGTRLPDWPRVME